MATNSKGKVLSGPDITKCDIEITHNVVIVNDEEANKNIVKMAMVMDERFNNKLAMHDDYVLREVEKRYGKSPKKGLELDWFTLAIIALGLIFAGILLGIGLAGT